MSRRFAWEVVRGLTTEQWGLASSAQMADHGLTRTDVHRLVVDGCLARVDGVPGVYRCTAVPVSDPLLDRLRCAWVQLGGRARAPERRADPDAIVAGRSALYVWQCGDAPPYVDFFVNRRRQPRRGDLHLRVRTRRGSFEVVDGLPVAPIDKVIGDLIQHWELPEVIGRACRESMRRRLTGFAILAAECDRFAPLYGFHGGGELIDSLERGRSSPPLLID